MINLIPICLTLFLTLTSAVHKIDFTIHKGDTNFANSSPFNKRLLKRTISSSNSSSNSTNGTVNLEIINKQSFYAASFKLGTPGKDFIAQVDTGSSDLWVYGSDNSFCSTSDSAGGNSSSGLDGYLTIDEKKYANVINPSIGTRLRRGSLFKRDNDSDTDPDSDPTSVGDDLYSSLSADIGEASATIDCEQFGVYSANDSSTGETNGTVLFIEYGDSTFAFGSFYQDVLTLGKDIEVEDFIFGVANLSNSSTPVLGIGLEGLESTNSTIRKELGLKGFTYPNLPSVLVEDGIIEKKAYSLYLNSLDSVSGSVLFGGVDHAKYEGQLVTVPVVNQFPELFDVSIYFDVELTGLTFEGKDLLGSDSDSDSGSNSTAGNSTSFQLDKRTNDTDTGSDDDGDVPENVVLLDSGSTLIYLFPDTTDSLASALDAKLDIGSGYYQLLCPSATDASKNVTFAFNGATIDVPLSNLLISSDDGKHCALAVQSTTDHQILGDVFLSSAYVVFDLEDLQISLAQAKYTNDTDIEEIVGEVPSAVPYSDVKTSSASASATTEHGRSSHGGRSSSSVDVDAFSSLGIPRSGYVSGSSIPISRTHYIEPSSIASILSSEFSSLSSGFSSYDGGDDGGNGDDDGSGSQERRDLRASVMNKRSSDASGSLVYHSLNYSIVWCFVIATFVIVAFV
ncbi:hypothetical protein WICPIJ_000739 [Wickerhamomyces pijperi]|uniref:Peptidase A1 domain-containing protein n=1 Tax=Wickerhamomyces pijperi TaxID=599730 RepID=A0A9P8QC77_WICPI|nr:hypothetical protein WICPIJ_000739 [Wickerhamomyces pijperi]